MTKLELMNQNNNLRESNRILLQDKVKLTRQVRNTQEDLKAVLVEVGELHEEIETKDDIIDTLEKIVAMYTIFLSQSVIDYVLEKVELERRKCDED